MTDLSIIIPFKTDNGPREKAFQWVVHYYKNLCPNVDICIGTCESPFSKARAINEAAMDAKGTIFAIIDADIICDPTILHESKLLLSQYNWVIPYNEIVNISEKSTHLLQQTSPSWPLPFHLEGKKRDYTKKTLPVGGINIMKRDSFEAVGGFDERFIGWGGEDDAFVAAMNTFCGHYERIEKTIYHLWHPPVKREDNEKYDDNARLARRYCRAQGRIMKMRKILEERKKR